MAISKNDVTLAYKIGNLVSSAAQMRGVALTTPSKEHANFSLTSAKSQYSEIRAIYRNLSEEARSAIPDNIDLILDHAKDSLNNVEDRISKM